MEKVAEAVRPSESFEDEVRKKAIKLLSDSFRYFIAHDALPQRKPFTADHFDQTERLLEYLGCPEDGSGRITGQQQVGVDIFFQEFHRFVREQRREPSARKKLDSYLQTWQEAAFSVSPNIFNWLSMEDQMLVSARFFRLPETRDTLGQNNIGELIYNLAFFESDEDRQRFLQRVYCKADPEAKLDLIHYLSLVARIAPEQGYGPAEDLLYSLRDFLTNIREQKEISPFVFYAATQALEESEQPFVEVPAEVKEETHRFGTWMKPDTSAEGEMYVRRISRDAIASFDALFTVNRLAWIEKQDEKPLGDRPVFSDLQRAIQLLEHPAYQQRLLERLVSFIEEHIMRYLSPSDHGRLYWNMQKRHPSDPEFFAKLRQQLERMKGQEEYQEIHFEFFESGDGNADTLLQEIHRPAMRAMIEHDMGISLADLSLREQMALLNYLVRVDHQTASKGFKAIRQFGVNGARAFLSCEYGKENGEAILKIGEQLEPEAAAAIFAKYVELLELTEESTDDLLKKSPRLVDRARLNEELMSRGKELIASYGRLVEKAPDAFTTEDILRRLQGAKKDIVVMAAVLQGYKKETGKSIDFSRLKEWFSLETIDLQDIPQKTRNKLMTDMRDILKANWIQKGDVAMKIALEGLEAAFSNPKGKTAFCFLRQGEEIIAFMRFDQRPDLGPNAIYAGSFNVNPDVRDPIGSTIGLPFFEEVLKQEASEQEIYAHVLVDDRVGARYVQDNGFVITGVEVDRAPKGQMVEWFRIRRAPTEMKTAGQSREKQKKQFIFPQERPAMLTWITSETEQGRVISGYIVERGASGERRVFTSETVSSAVWAEAA